MIDYIAGLHTTAPYLADTQREMEANYKLFNNILDQKDFEMECNPLGISVGQFQDEIKPYNKTYNKIQVLLGEELKRPFNFKAVLTSPGGIKSKNQKKNDLIKQYIQAELQAAIAQAKAKVGNIPPEEAEEAIQKLTNEVMDPSQIDKYMSTTYQESVEILSNKMMDFLIIQQDIKSKKNDAFKHGLISDFDLGWVGVENGNPVVNLVNPQGFIYDKSPEVKFIEEGSFAGTKVRMSTIDILNIFGDYLSPEDIKKIDTPAMHASSTFTKEITYPHFDPFSSFSMGAPQEGSYGVGRAFDHVVTHVEWRSQRKVGFLEFINEYGDIESTLVTEDFPVPSYATTSIVEDSYNNKTTYYQFDEQRLHWTWVDEVWSGIRINEDIYCQIGPKDFQGRSMDTYKSVKLGYHGAVFSTMNAKPCSLMTRMKPFQYLFLIIMHTLKRLIARDKGAAIGIDTSMIDGTLGMEKTLYYLEEMGYNFFNSLQNADQRGASTRSGKVGATIDRSNMSAIQYYVQLLSAIDDQISDVAGVSRGREGQTSPTEAVTNAQQNLSQSATITETYFYLHNRVWENILTSLLEVAQYAWKDKHILKQWVLDDASTVTLELKPGDITNETMSIFVQDSSKQHRAFEFAERHFLELLQNDRAKFSTMLEMFQTNSLSEFTRTVKQEERAQEANLQAQQQAEQQASAQALQNAKDMVILKGNIDKELAHIKGEYDLQKAEITSFIGQEDLDSDDNGIPDPLEIEKFKTDTQLKITKLQLDKKKIDLDQKKHEDTVQLKEKELSIKKKQANRPSSSK